MKVSIVIPAYNRYDLLNQLLLGLFQYCSLNIHEVLIVDDGSTEQGFEEGVTKFWFKEKLLPVKMITQKNQGFLKASNKGMKEASGDVLVLISTDVQVKSDFVSQVLDLLEAEPKSLIGNRLIAFDTGWNVFGDRAYQYLEGWLLACTKETWEELGGFDERFSPNDYEDVDLSTTALDKGYLLLSLDDSKVTHMGAQTYGYNPEREAITKINKEKFREKWTK